MGTSVAVDGATRTEQCLMDEYAIFVEGLAELDDLDSLSSDITKNIMRAVNTTADRFRTQSERDMRQEIAFSASYLRDKLTVSKKATQQSLEAVISGRDRPTSLARFVTSGQLRKAGVTVQVKPGQTQTLEGAFLLTLKNGNRGLAVRLPAGQSLRNSSRAKKLSNNVYLLYGPDVSQVFKGVAGDEAPKALAFLEREFLRLMDARI